MKIINLILFGGAIFFTGCYMGPATYEIFERQKNFVVKNKTIVKKNIYT